MDTPAFIPPRLKAPAEPLPAIENIRHALDPLLTYLVDQVIRISRRSVFYSQDEILDLIDLVSLAKADIFGIMDRYQTRTITRTDARLL